MYAFPFSYALQPASWNFIFELPWHPLPISSYHCLPPTSIEPCSFCRIRVIYFLLPTFCLLPTRAYAYRLMFNFSYAACSWRLCGVCFLSCLFMFCLRGSWPGWSLIAEMKGRKGYGWAKAVGTYAMPTRSLCNEQGTNIDFNLPCLFVCLFLCLFVCLLVCLPSFLSFLSFLSFHSFHFFHFLPPARPTQLESQPTYTQASAHHLHAYANTSQDT